MFENLSTKLNATFKKLTNKGVLTESNIEASIKEVKAALLEADVNYRVVNAFLKLVKARALGSEVMGALTPGQQFIKVVNEELVTLMGKENHSLALSDKSTTIIMLVGLQGSGKTTTAAKLANRLKKEGKTTYLVPADIYRPAAIDQLTTLAKNINIPCFPTVAGMKPAEIVKKARVEAEASACSHLIIDTAGRLHVDEELMDELKEIKATTSPHEILLVVDAMVGQDAVNVSKAFNEKLGINGVILTKMDGDARGGAALSIRAVTEKPVKFIGVGEKITDLEPFYPERIASKILGMGDLTTLMEKAQEHFDSVKAQKLTDKIKKNSFTLDDFLDQLQQIKKMGPIGDLIKMIPGMSAKMPKNVTADEKQLVKIEAIISSMTMRERENHQVINGSRRLRIAKGSGTQVSDVNRLLKQFIQMKKMMKKFSSPGKSQNSARAMQQMMGAGGMPPF